MKHSFIAILGILAISLACTKEEGTGGQSTIKGKIVRVEYAVDSSLVTKKDSFVIQREIPAANEDVFIIYGNNSSIGDKLVTSYDGSFEFNYLQAGKYKIVTYSDDTLNVYDKKMSVIKEITISDSKTADIGTLKSYKKLNVEGGNGSISGRVWFVNWTKNFISVKDITLAQEMDVYLTYGNHAAFDVRVRTSYDGTFVFPHLVKGNYTFFAYTAEKKFGEFTGSTYRMPILVHDTITRDNEHIVLKDIYVDSE